MVSIKIRKNEIEKIKKNVIDYEQAQKEFEETRNKLKKKKNGYNQNYIFKQLNEKENLRKVFLAVVKNHPARLSEIMEDSLTTKPTTYAQLHKLLDLELIGRVWVNELIQGISTNEEVLEKYRKWTKNMTPKMERYYMSKTSFWVVSNFGKCFVKKAFEFEQHYREESNMEE